MYIEFEPDTIVIICISLVFIVAIKTWRRK
jgi:hypothetical protein